MFDSKRTGFGTQEWAEATHNIQRGCVNDCLYCYAAAMAARFGSRKRENWYQEELIATTARHRFSSRGGVIMMPSTHDITPANVKDFIHVAQLILGNGNELLIVTKPRLSVMEEVMTDLAAWKEQIQIRVTIGSVDQELTAFWEPGAPHPRERLDVLAAIEAKGFARSVSIEPMLGGVVETLQVVDSVQPFNPESISIGKMNHLRQRVASRTPEMKAAILAIEDQQCDSEIMKLYRALTSVTNIRWKDSISKVVARA